MSVKLPETSPHAGQDGQTPVEGVVWLPRARLRSGRGGNRLLASLAVATVSVFAFAAGFATFNRMNGLPGANSASISSEKASERASAPQPFVEPAPMRAAALAPAPSPARQEVRQEARQEARQDAIQPPATPSRTPDLPPPQAKPAPEPAREIGGASDVRSPAELAAEATAAQASPVAPAPAAERKPVFEPVPPMPPSAARAPPPPSFAAAPARAPEPFKAADPIAASDPPLPPVREARAAPPAAQPAAPAANGDARVAVYLDEFPDQKAAAAGLSQKSGAYAAHIGSAGKLTYTRRFGDSWRLRVADLDQATAEALCAKLKAAGAPCVVGPNN